MKRPIVAIAGTGRGLPAGVMTNFDFAKIGIETTDEWITERTGIKQRHIAREGESTTTMAAAAARQAMQRSGVSAGEFRLRSAVCSCWTAAGACRWARRSARLMLTACRAWARPARPARPAPPRGVAAAGRTGRWHGSPDALDCRG